jgi:hypothetical protein
MKIKKLNKTHRVFQNGDAIWVAMFTNPDSFMGAILQMSEAFGRGGPYTGFRGDDQGRPWMFRQIDFQAATPLTYHAIYLTTEEQVTFLTLAYREDD